MTQREWVEKQLRENGEITRNQCLARYISRLGAIICDMRADGWEIDASSREGDYVYKLVQAKKRPVYEYELVDGIRRPKLTFV